MPADLHVHTTCSDSTLGPAEVIRECIAAGIGTVAITDHDALEGIAPAAEAGREAGVRVVPGIELTAYEGATEIHILGLFIDPDHAALHELIAHSRRARRERVYRMVEKLRALHVDISADDVFRIAGPGVPGRMHLAQALVRCGQVSCIGDAFKYYIANHGPAHVPKYKLPPPEASRAVRDAGGVSILGHPGVGLSDALVRRMIDDGVQGIEVYHPLHSAWHVEHYEAMARELGVLVSGGSDSHGGVRTETQIGAATVPDEVVGRIEEHARAGRRPPRTHPANPGENRCDCSSD